MADEREEVTVEADSVAKSFGRAAAVSDVSLKLVAGEIYGLLGPNAAGKSTLIRLLIGLLLPDSGTIRLLGKPVPDVALLSRIGYMTQQHGVYLDLSVEENIRFFAALTDSEENVEETLQIVHLVERRSSLVGTLSGGMRQRCSLACAMVSRPDVLLLDEPTVGVDPALRASFWEHFRRLASSGTTILVTSHVMDEAERCDRLGLMHAGRFIAEGTMEDIVKIAGVTRLEDAFLALSQP